MNGNEGFQADLTGKSKLSSFLTSAFGESRGRSTLSYMIITFLTGETGVCRVFGDSCTNKGRISGLCTIPLLPPCELLRSDLLSHSVHQILLF